MTIEELTEENLSLKEQLKAEQEKTNALSKSHEEDSALIVNLRSKNAELYSQIGQAHEVPQVKSEEEKRNEFWNNYVSNKTNGGKN